MSIVASITAVARSADAEGVQVGARGGVQLLDDGGELHERAAFVGADVRLLFQLSPLIVNLTFDHFFLTGQSLDQLGMNALYDLPLGTSFLYPYVGAGVGLARFALPETAGAGDSNGMRVGLNMIGGVRFEHVALPVVRPFVQGMTTLGPIALFSVCGGFLLELAGR